MNGSGAPWFRADVGILDGKIAAVGDLKGTDARWQIDAQDRAVSPGFIDMHSHSDFNLLVNRRAESKIRQGVTTEVIGQCGNSAAYASKRQLDELRNEWGEDVADLTWSNMAEYMELLEEGGLAVNCATLIGQGNIRRCAVGERDRAPTPEESAEMQSMLEEALQAGAFGMSTGLIYPPGVYSETAELVRLARVLGDYNAIYFTHLRDEGSGHSTSLKEAVEIGREGECQIQVSHLKVVGEDNWGRAGCALEILEDARRGGIPVFADQYPYVATATGLTASLPAWAHDGGRDEMLARLRDAGQRNRMKEEMRTRGQWDRLLISRVAGRENRQYEGMTVADIASDRGMEPEDAVFDLLLEEGGMVGSVRFAMDEEDVRTIMQSPLVMVGSDGSALSPRGPLGKGKPHPRSYGTFPRVLGKYAREAGVLSMEEAVAKMTSRPAMALGLWDRGLLLPGCWADIVIFAPDRVRDQATFTEPHQFPRGIDMAMVNGTVVLDGDEQGDALPGRVLRRE